MDDRLLFKDRVRERDLDNFLIEELHASKAFRDWLLARLCYAFDEPTGCEVRLQKSPPRLQDSRQTDVRIGWFDPVGALRGCVLIESKVTADFQPGQAESYAAERAEHRTRMGLRSAASVLVAPQARLSALAHDGAFDATVSIEEIIATLDARLRADDLSAELSARLTVRIDLLESLCGKRSVSAWTPVTVEVKRDFAVAYAALAAEILPALRVRPSTDGPKAITRIFEGLDLGADLPPATLRHEFGAGAPTKYANVQFRGSARRVPAVHQSDLLTGTPYEVAEAGKALAIRVPTPGIDPTLPFEREREKVRAGLEAISALVIWLGEHGPRLSKILASSELSRPAPATAPHSSPDAREAEFADALRNTYDECAKLGYRPFAMLEMVDRLGGIETARRLLANPPSDGFARLALLKRLDLAIESLVLEPRWDGLFTEAELRTARRRLR
jgi:hypothetical protein